jgi:hypothetical protein
MRSLLSLSLRSRNPGLELAPETFTHDGPYYYMLMDAGKEIPR